MISKTLYNAIVKAERAARDAHNICYEDGGKHGANMWLSMGLGRAQSILMHYVVKYANEGKVRP